MDAHRLQVVGTFNGWSVDHPDYGLTLQADRRFEGPVHLPGGRHAFKFAANGAWDLNWGGDSVGPVLPPRSGLLGSGGPDISLHVPFSGRYNFNVDLEAGTWAIRSLEAGLGPANALQPRHNAGLLPELMAHPDRLLPAADFQGQLPLTSNEDVVFVLDGEDDEPVWVAGDWNDWSTTAHRMHQADGVRVLHLRLARDRAWQYKFYHRGVWFKDPHNRMVTWDGYNRHNVGDFNSVLPPAHGLAEGAMVWLKNFHSVFLDDERDVFVMLPPGYRSDYRYPVLYVNDGNESITRGQYHLAAAASMAAGRCEPMIMVFIALPDQNVRAFQYVHGDGWPRYARFVADELVPFIDSQFNTRPDRCIIGASLGGVNAWYVAFQHPNVFGKAAAQSGSFYVNGQDLIRRIRDERPVPIQLYLDSSRPGTDGGRGDMSGLGNSVAQALRHRGYWHMHYQTRGDRHDWWYWANRLPTALEFLWPGPVAQVRSRLA